VTYTAKNCPLFVDVMKFEIYRELHDIMSVFQEIYLKLFPGTSLILYSYGAVGI